MNTPRSSIKHQIVFSFIVLLGIIFGISSYFVYVNWLGSVEQATQKILENVGDRVYRQIDRFVDIPLNINNHNVLPIRRKLVDLADDKSRDLFFANQIKTSPLDVYSFTYGTENGHFFGARRNPQNEIEIYRNNAESDGKNRYYKTNPDLSTGAFVMETARFDPRGRDWYQTAKIQRGPFFSPVYPHFVMNDLAISAVDPVYSDGGELQGVLGTHLTLSRLNRYVATIAEDYAGVVYVVEADNGNLVANSQTKPNFLQTGPQRIERINVEQIDVPEIVQAYKRWKSEQIRGFSSQQWFVRAQPYERLGLNWLIIAAVPQEPYMAPLRQGIYYSLLITLLVVILAIFLYVKSTDVVLKPIRNLIQTTERFTAGEFAVRAAVFHDDEIGILSRAFNKMADEICQLINSLEDKIKDRTSELEQMNRLARQAQLEAQEANETKDAFLANMSHELRTSLSAVLGYSELLQGDGGLSKRNREYVGTIHRSGLHMLTLINDVLDIAKIESKKMTLYSATFDLAGQVDDVTNMLKLRADAKQLEYVVTGRDNLPRSVQGDATKLRVVLLNLIGNAIKFTESGSVHVDFSATAESAGEILFAVTVKDTGSGIDPAEQEKLFQFFSQTESGRLSQSGTGLGLAISQEYIRMMGGEIRVSSQVGAGSRFSFEIVLKLAEGEVKYAPTGALRRVVGLKDGRKAPRVLVAEDTEENRTLLVRQLGPLGMEIYSAADGQEAVDQFLRHQPDLIWMDIRMPVLDGIEATRRIKAMTQGARTKIIAVSAHAFESEKDSLRAAGFDGFVAKPYQAAELYQTMAELLGLEYIYEMEPESAGALGATAPIRSDAALELPDELRQALRAAVIRLDVIEVNRLIHSLKESNPNAAAVLSQLANNLEYSQMLRLIDEGKE